MKTKSFIPALLGLAALFWAGPSGANSPSGSAGASAAADKLNAALIGGAIDASGNIYLADSEKNVLQKIAPNGTVATLAGRENSRGNADGYGGAAQFNGPQSVAIDSSGNVYVADAGNHAIRKVTSTGSVTTLAGSPGISGNSDGTGSDARFAFPQGLAIDLRGNLYVADTGNHSIRKITPFGVVTTLAGSGFPGYADGSGREAKFYSPTRVTLDGAGALFVADTGNNLIRKVTDSGVATTLAGAVVRQGRSGVVGGYADGVGAAARFNSPEGIVLDENGNLVVADSGNEKVRKITGGGAVSTIDGISSPHRRRDFSNRGGFRGRRNQAMDLFVFGGFERLTGNYIAGGLPSPGDIDVRLGKPQQQPLFFQTQTVVIGGNPSSRDTHGSRHRH